MIIAYQHIAVSYLLEGNLFYCAGCVGNAKRTVVILEYPFNCYWKLARICILTLHKFDKWTQKIKIIPIIGNFMSLQVNGSTIIFLENDAEVFHQKMDMKQRPYELWKKN